MYSTFHSANASFNAFVFSRFSLDRGQHLSDECDITSASALAVVNASTCQRRSTQSVNHGMSSAIPLHSRPAHLISYILYTDSESPPMRRTVADAVTVRYSQSVASCRVDRFTSLQLLPRMRRNIGPNGHEHFDLMAGFKDPVNTNSPLLLSSP